MNLVIDVGNTSIKVGVFKKTSMLYKETLKSNNLSLILKELKKEYPSIKLALLSSVSHLKKEDIDDIKRLFPMMVLDHKVQMPFKNLYKTPTTLGVDRLALVAAAVCKYPKKNVLVIDAGTCITYDFKNKEEEYIGGAISPGLQLRYTSLHNFTSKLPLLELEPPTHYIGNSTNQAIHAGVVLGVLYEIEGTIAEYCNTYTDLTVILTGGDAHFLSKRFKNSIFATSNFLLEGLNYILAFNYSQ